MRILLAMFQGGGNIPLILPVAARLVARGHDVRVLAGPGVRGGRMPVSDRFVARIAATGARYIPFAMPAVHPFDEARPQRGLVRGWIPERLADATSNAPTLLWSPAWATNAAAELRRAPADVVVADYILLGALAAADATGVPAAALVHGTYKHRPAPGLPACGPGFPPARGPLGHLRDALYNAAAVRVFRRDGLPPHNRARRDLGLSPLRSPFEQYDRAARVLILASAAFDFPIRRLPANVRYVGAPSDDAGAAWEDPWPTGDGRPLVLVSLSTLPQGQVEVMPRILAALDGLPVRALVTLGPALADAAFDAPANVRLERFVPHGAVLPEAAALVTQCGMSTVAKALGHGVPMVCIPLQGDQPDNAARVVARGAGVRLSRDASPERIRGAIQRVLDEPRFREGARRLAAALATEDGAETAATEIEGMVG
jgi:UDP:flavonoid glycosyltransferase YjiC (YdhE family)